MAPNASSGPPGDVLGAYIRAQRQLADLSLRQLAGLSNVSNAYLSQIERGLHQPSLKVLRSIASALNLSGETMLTQAGLIDPEAPGAKARSGTEAAILSDPDLTDEEKHVLLGVYRNFRQRHE
ncbi:MAG: helix-turn-helix transcriptional regulator [Propionibacteriales bacterium]|nr:helix-turn-helix transcriptional regulator [Propionibacteriales bacterium]